MMPKIDALLVDDDSQNLELLRFFLNKYCPSVNIIGEASNVEDTIAIINKLAPQLIYLDIQLQEKNAFEILDRIDLNEIKIIFVTAYSDYALQAFKCNAIDYILKPLSIEDVIIATNKVLLKLEEKKKFNQLIAREKTTLSDNRETENDEHIYITINSLDKMILLKKNDIIFCKSEGRYTIFFLKNNVEHVSSKNLGEYDLMFNKKKFVRIHHSYIVNLSHVLSINKKQGYYCEMSSGERLPVARRRQDDLKKILNF